MEGIGSRTGRPSSRYGAAPVFTGPVRRWQKQWVHVSSSVSYNHTSNRSNSTANNNNTNNISAVRIRRWTPVPSVHSGDESESAAEERPKRKMRYAPIVVLEGKKREAEKSVLDDKETSKTSQSAAQGTSENDDDDDEKKNSYNVPAAKAQASQKGTPPATKDLNNQPMDLDIGDDDDNEDHDLGGTDKATDWVKAAQKDFAC
ncbi:hypothetical protein SSX86_006830 [Deinandra increscens subsp. villosa]|uniref:Uncharacterized protein n=1 Tax=Deinandra increscens subsp. villosa TaxID=3103831 RepID=A0AAP0H463_9ASTR